MQNKEIVSIFTSDKESTSVCYTFFTTISKPSAQGHFHYFWCDAILFIIYIFDRIIKSDNILKKNNRRNILEYNNNNITKKNYWSISFVNIIVEGPLRWGGFPYTTFLKWDFMHYLYLCHIIDAHCNSYVH